MKSIPRICIAGTHSGAGKTTVTLAILAALTRRGISVAPFKVGPDFIDPSHHRAVTGRPSRNLDTWMLSENTVLEILERGARDAKIAVIEGVMGLYDGFSGTEDIGSTAHLAKMIRCPVVLVLDASAMARSAAAMIKGYIEFDSAVQFAGVIFNNVGSAGHYRYLKDAVEHTLSIPVLGYLPRNPKVKIPERHLGLVPAQEREDLASLSNTLADMSESLNLDLLLDRAGQAPPLRLSDTLFSRKAHHCSPRPRIAVASDKAFQFYYQENLELLEHAGAELVSFSPMKDTSLPKGTQLLYLAGGFPEVYARELSANRSLLQEIKDFILKEKKPVYAECGGLMILCESLRDFDGNEFPMVGVIPAVAAMDKKLRGFGYVQAEVTRDNLLSKKGQALRGHEFHYSYLEERPGFEKLNFAYRLQNRLGQTVKADGIVIENLLASYTHLHFASAPQIAGALLRRLGAKKTIHAAIDL